MLDALLIIVVRSSSKEKPQDGSILLTLVSFWTDFWKGKDLTATRNSREFERWFELGLNVVLLNHQGIHLRLGLIHPPGLCGFDCVSG